jgi:large subunit ribosomal protein L29
MEMKELRDMADAELVEKEHQLRQELFNLRFQLATGRIENPMRIRQTRHDLARVKTVLRQNATASAAPAGKSRG